MRNLLVTLSIVSLLASPAASTDLECGTTGQSSTPNTKGEIFLQATEQLAIDGAVGNCSPDSCKRCPGGAPRCTEINTFSNTNFDVNTHQHPNGSWSAEAWTSPVDPTQPMSVQTECAPCP